MIKPHPDFIRPDRDFQKIFTKQNEKLQRRAVESLFGSNYKDVTKKDLHLFIEDLLERFYLLKKYMPDRLIDVIKGVLAHPDLSHVDKNVQSLGLPVVLTL